MSAYWTPQERERALAIAAELKKRGADRPAWRQTARTNQLPPPGNWRIWLFLAGRGTGKTRAGAEYVLEQVRSGARRVALVAPTAGDARDVMVEGESGILACALPGERPLYEPSKRRLTWPGGAIATTYSADEPDRLRGPQHDLAWSDEVAAWRYPATFDMLMLGLRLGRDPRCVVTTTPRPVALVRDMLKDEQVAVTKGNTYENREHLAPAFFERIVAKYEGTRLGRQEIHAEVLEDTQGSLWQREMIDGTRRVDLPDFDRIVVGVDPEATSGENSAETGIVTVGAGLCACKGVPERHGFVLSDNSRRDTPHNWASEVVAAYHKHRADRIIAEDNNGGEMVQATIESVWAQAPVQRIHASRNKQARAEPIAALYEQGRVHHVGMFPELEDQLCNWVPGSGPSPDRLDALVWALTELDIAEAVMSQAAVEAANPATPSKFASAITGGRWKRNERTGWHNR